MFFFSFLSITSFSQECFEYHENNCFPKESKFSYQTNNASVSFLFSSGEARDIAFSFLLGKDYRITVCSDNIFNNIIEIAIINEEHKVLYNNNSQNYNLNLEFSCKKTQDVIFRIKAPELNIEPNDTLVYEGCIGLLIEEMVSVKTGF